MLNIPQFRQRVNVLYRRMMRLSEAGQYYARIARTDLALPPTQFYYFTQLKRQENFRSHRVDLRKQRRYMKDVERGPVRSGRTLRRVLAQLEARGLVRRDGRRFVDMIPDRRRKEVRLDLLYMIQDTIDARILRFFLLLAFWPKGRPLSDLTVDGILAVTGGDRVVALELHKWLQGALSGLSRKALRRRVFYADRPAWWLYAPCACPEANHWLGWTAGYSFPAGRSDFDRYGGGASGSGSSENKLSRIAGPPARFAETSRAGPATHDAELPNGHNQHAPRPTKTRSQAVERLAEILARIKGPMQPTRPGDRTASLNVCSAAGRSRMPRYGLRRRYRPPPDRPPGAAPPWWNVTSMGPYLR